MLNLNLAVGAGEDMVKVVSAVSHDWRQDYAEVETVTLSVGRQAIVLNRADALKLATAIYEAGWIEDLERKHGIDDPDARFDGISAHFGHD